MLSVKEDSKYSLKITQHAAGVLFLFDNDPLCYDGSHLLIFSFLTLYYSTKTNHRHHHRHLDFGEENSHPLN